MVERAPHPLIMLAVVLLMLLSHAAIADSTDIDLSSYGFTPVSRRNVLEGISSRPRCLFLDQNHVAVVAFRRGPASALARRDKPDSQRGHYSGVVINLSTKKVVSTVDLGGADYYADGEVLSDGTLVFYRHGSLDFWRLGVDETLQKQVSISIDVQEIDAALSSTAQARGFGLYPSYSHNVLYLYVAAPISGIAKLWRVTSDTAKPLARHLYPLFLLETVESETSIIGLRDASECRFFLIPNQAEQSPRELYHQESCQYRYTPAFIGPDEVVIGSALKTEPPEFRRKSGEPISHPGVNIAGRIAAAWDQSSYIVVRLGSSGGIEALDIGSHTNKATVTVFDAAWHERCRLVMKVKGADLSGPYLSPKGDRIIAYDNAHFYAWDVNELARRSGGKTQ